MGQSMAAQLPLMLPWLPAYDRRDALVVLQLLGTISKASDLAAEISLEERTCALAASAYVAARFEPSAGDPVGELSLSEWLG